MHEEEIRGLIHQAVDHAGWALTPDPSLAQRIMRRERKEERMKKKWSAGLILALALLLLTAAALAVALLSPQEIVEQAAVPLAQSNQRENYTYEELAALLRALNENGITLDEGSALMRAFQAGRGYWERETIEEICYSAFGKNQGAWTLEQRHWYGEMMTAIGAWKVNVNLLPGEGDLSPEEARTLAVQALRDAYGVELPRESDENWQVGEFLQLVWDEETDGFPTEKAEWTLNYVFRRSDALFYTVSFGRAGQNVSPWRAGFLSSISASTIQGVMEQLEEREGSRAQWRMETWAEFGHLIEDMTPDTRSGWLYRRAGYRLPPEGAMDAETALALARDATEATGRIAETILCCADRDRPIYKVCLRISPEDRQDAEIRCVEMDCMTGEVLDKRPYVRGLESDPLMMYAPFSLLREAPAFEKDAAATEKERAAADRAEEETAAEKEYGMAYMYFLPLEKQAALYGGFHTVPTQAAYDSALQIARDAVARQYGADALDSLGNYRIGAAHQENGSVEDGSPQHVWDFLFTTDPEYLSDGFRVQFRQPIVPGQVTDAVRDLTVEHAGLGNG